MFYIHIYTINMFPPLRWHASITTYTQKLRALMILFFEQFKKCREKTQKLEPKSCKIFGLDFFWEWKKTKKLQKCKNATLQLFGLIAFYYCCLITKGKKQQKLQSCKVAKLHFCNFLFFFQKFLAQKILDFCGFFFESEKFGFQKPYPYFFGAWIPTVFMSETLSLFFGVGIDLNSFYFINRIPIFWGGMDLNSFYFRNLIPIFLGGLDLNSFFSETLSLSFVWGDGSQQFSFQKPYPYFLSGFHLNSFHFRNLLPIF